MDRVQRRGATLLFAFAGLAYLLDRLTKLWAERTLQDAPADMIPGVLTLRFTTNSGGAFSIGGSAPWLFAGATIIVSVLIVATAFRHRNMLTAVALGLILGGALGNLTDRVVRGSGLHGRVVDFIDFHTGPSSTSRIPRSSWARCSWRSPRCTRTKRARPTLTREAHVATAGRLDAVLAELTGLPRADVQRAIAAGRVTVDGEPRAKSFRLAGERRS